MGFGAGPKRERERGVLILALAQRADLGVERAEALLVLARLLLLLALRLRVILLRVELLLVHPGRIARVLLQESFLRPS